MLNVLNDWAKMNRMVRITHKPTGITAVASEYRSQHRNRDAAYAQLKSKVAVGSAFPLPLRASYDFPDDEPCPDDINKYRQGGHYAPSVCNGERNADGWEIATRSHLGRCDAA